MKSSDGNSKIICKKNSNKLQVKISEEYIRALAKVRGAESGMKYAESFVLMRGIRK